MIFTKWKKYPNKKPKEDGWYHCIVQNSGRVMDLYFNTGRGGVWVDLRRKQVFEGYKVYKAGREPFEYNRVFEDGLCEREDVIRWRKMPRSYERALIKVTSGM